MNHSALTVENLSVTHNNRKIVENISFRFNKERINFLIGPNGSGKSTIIKAALHLLPINKYEVYGKIKINNNTIWHDNKSNYFSDIRSFLLTNVGYINQSPFNTLDNTKTIYQHFNEKKLLLKKFNKKKYLYKTNELLTEIGCKDDEIRHILNSYPRNLSGGWMQLVNISLALYGSPDLIIADEGFDYLDIFKIEHALKFIVNKVLNKSKDTKKLTPLIICHDYYVIHKVKKIIESLKSNISMDNIITIHSMNSKDE